MRKIIIILTIIITPLISFAQSEKESDVKMISEYSSENQEMADLLQFQNIDFYKIKFVGKNINNKNYILTCKEMWDGNLKNIDTIINTNLYPQMPKTKSDTLNLKIFAKRTPEPKLKLWFRFPKFGIDKKYDAILSDDYSLRDTGISEKIIYGENFYAFSYILPYENNGMKFWCGVESSGKDIENWGKEFKLKHYLIFEMKFE